MMMVMMLMMMMVVMCTKWWIGKVQIGSSGQISSSPSTWCFRPPTNLNTKYLDFAFNKTECKCLIALLLLHPNMDISEVSMASLKDKWVQRARKCNFERWKIELIYLSRGTGRPLPHVALWFKVHIYHRYDPTPTTTAIAKVQGGLYNTHQSFPRVRWSPVWVSMF